MVLSLLPSSCCGLLSLRYVIHVLHKHQNHISTQPLKELSLPQKAPVVAETKQRNKTLLQFRQVTAIVVSRVSSLG